MYGIDISKGFKTTNQPNLFFAYLLKIIQEIRHMH
jgi:hypothetical protein